MDELEFYKSRVKSLEKILEIERRDYSKLLKQRNDRVRELSNILIQLSSIYTEINLSDFSYLKYDLSNPLFKIHNIEKLNPYYRG